MPNGLRPLLEGLQSIVPLWAFVRFRLRRQLGIRRLYFRKRVVSFTYLLFLLFKLLVDERLALFLQQNYSPPSRTQSPKTVCENSVCFCAGTGMRAASKSEYAADSSESAWSAGSAFAS